MTESIISRETIRARARSAFATGQSRDSHGMNPGAAALVDWLAEYDRLTAERANDISRESRRALRAAKNPPLLHSERAGGAQFVADQTNA
jgi:hypothetical protein